MKINYYEFYKIVAEPIVVFWYRVYENIFLHDSMGLNDIKQEILIVIWQQVKKYKKGKSKIKNLGAYLTTCVIFKLSNLKRNAEANRKFFIQKDKVIKYKKHKQAYKQNYNDENFITSLSKKYIKPKPLTLMYNIKQFCSKREYLIIQKIYDQNMNFAEIGRELKISRERIRQIHDKAIKKIKINKLDLLDI